MSSTARAAALDQARKSVPHERWEHGSFFHLSAAAGRADYPWATTTSSLWGSGRDALRALAREGVASGRWRALLVPSYFCQETLGSLAGEIELRSYPCGPLSPLVHVDAGPGEAVLSVALFGAPPRVVTAGGAAIVEDHTHDPTSLLAARSNADFVVASLRKTLPLPDGGVVWSPRGHAVPQETDPTPGHAVSTLARLGAMALKQAYMCGARVSKEDYRRLHAAAEGDIGTGPPSGISGFSRARLSSLPVAEWRDARARNREVFMASLGKIPGVEILDVPFAAVALFGHEDRRDSVRQALAAARVYAAVLWPLDHPVVAGVSQQDLSFSRRMLALHLDHRYEAGDMRRVATLFRRAVLEA